MHSSVSPLLQTKVIENILVFYRKGGATNAKLKLWDKRCHEKVQVLHFLQSNTNKQTNTNQALHLKPWLQPHVTFRWKWRDKQIKPNQKNKTKQIKNTIYQALHLNPWSQLFQVKTLERHKNSVRAVCLRWFLRMRSSCYLFRYRFRIYNCLTPKTTPVFL